MLRAYATFTDEIINKLHIINPILPNINKANYERQGIVRNRNN